MVYLWNCQCYFFDKLRKTASAKIFVAHPLYATITALEEPSIPSSNHYKKPKDIVKFFSVFPNERVATVYQFNFKLIWLEHVVFWILLMTNSNGAYYESLEPRSGTLKLQFQTVSRRNE